MTMQSTSTDDLRTRLIDHILWLKQQDPDYARDALLRFHQMLPHLELMAGVRERLQNA